MAEREQFSSVSRKGFDDNIVSQFTRRHVLTGFGSVVSVLCGGCLDSLTIGSRSIRYCGTWIYNWHSENHDVSVQVFDDNELLFEQDVTVGSHQETSIGIPAEDTFAHTEGEFSIRARVDAGEWVESDLYTADSEAAFASVIVSRDGDEVSIDPVSTNC